MFKKWHELDSYIPIEGQEPKESIFTSVAKKTWQQVNNWQPIEKPVEEPKGPGLGKRVARRAAEGAVAFVSFWAGKKLEERRNNKKNNNTTLTPLDSDIIEGQFWEKKD